jgi:hypothetical protein
MRGPIIAGNEHERGNVEPRLALDLVADFAGALDHDDPLQGGPLMQLLQPVDVVDDGNVPGLDASVIATDSAFHSVVTG